MNGTDFRLFYEKYAIYRLAEHLGIPVNKISHLTAKLATSVADAEYNSIKYDIKFAVPTLTSKDKRTVIWDFDLHKRFKGKNVGHFGSEYLICVGMLKGIPAKVFLVPTENAPKRHLRISINGNSKWHKFII